MISEKVQDAIQILDYWFTMEFLSQNSYEMCTNVADTRRKLREYKKKLAGKQIEAFLDLEKGQSLCQTIQDECERCQMQTWGTITVYLGKIKRESCIAQIARYIGADMEEMPEKSYDEIVAASFQIDENGRYLPYSFSLSSIVWAISQLKDKERGRLSDGLSLEEYQNTIYEIDKGFRDFLENEFESGKAETEEVESEAIEALYARLENEYLGTLEGEYSCGISVCFFKDEAAKKAYGENNYSGLSRSYFSNDLQMVKKWMESEAVYLETVDEKTKNRRNGMLQYLLDYINGPGHETEFREKRCDFLRISEEELEVLLLKKLNMKRAPMGKWPSRYMPALMQQVAINAAADEEREAFSVNGPPGTGKTTLLKEIIANHIVEKAKRLAAYDDPDTAFEKHKFLHGDKENGKYSRYIPGWYSLKDDKINDYSILVVSSNNAAVENITKELPLESGILDSLKPTGGDDERVKEQLREIEQLFSAEQSDKSEHLYCRKTELEGDYKEIYFTGYAKKLMQRPDAWGLAAAPLGKKSNLVPFYKYVLEPLHWDFYPNGQFKEARRERYEAARKAFEEQLEKVAKLQDELSSLGDAALSAKKAERRSQETKAHYTKQIEAQKETRNFLLKEIEEIEKKLQELQERYQEEEQKKKPFQAERDEGETVWKEKNQKLIQVQKQICEVMNSVGIFSRILFKEKYQAAKKLAESYQSQEADLQTEIEQAKQKIQDLEEEIRSIEIQEESIKAEEKTLDVRLEEIRLEDGQVVTGIEEAKKQIQSAAEEAETAQKEWMELAEHFQEKEPAERGHLLDKAFISALRSSDAEQSAKAQTTNPWTTDYYNREREKLLYAALQLTKEFILNSRCCRDNFITLSQYWGLEMGEENDQIHFHKEDREQMAGALYQTLFLLVPVISSTFASVGTLFQDIKMQGTIGTLVVDEAGQAQPQMAVGALYRSRKAIIVGDPKQVEPVVTDDLALLKKSFKEELYRSYQDKSLSVQRCADILNPLGTYLENGTDQPEWVGCPLLVHRRCISPMYDISNRISYSGIMKQQTRLPGEEKQKSFVFDKSQWIHITGTENGRKDHFVRKQGEAVCRILEKAFEKSEFPNLYIISPFKSVVYGIRNYIKEYSTQNLDFHLNKTAKRDDWIKEKIGTVHTFQGKEANEVIFLLGCDAGKEAAGAVRWVNSNIVNVAVTRAKYRLYVIGDSKAWEPNRFVCEMKAVMDTYALKEIAALQKTGREEDVWQKDGRLEEKRLKAIKEAVRQIPSVHSFPIKEQAEEAGTEEYQVDTEGFLNNLAREDFLNDSFREEQLLEFGLKSPKDLESLPLEIKRNLIFGMKLYYLLRPLFEWNMDLDASCCGILFCKALELQLQSNFYEGLKKQFPEHLLRISGKAIPLKDAEKKHLMLGTISYLLKKYGSEIADCMQSKGEPQLHADWWKAFREKLNVCVKKRNQCCHGEWFQWNDMLELIEAEFQPQQKECQASDLCRLGGVFFESTAGKKL
ncbi:MAG: AAA domain-containing protein [Lachnospirales bacterium]